MLTPEEKKLFTFLYRLGKSYGLDYVSYTIEFDDYLPDEPELVDGMFKYPNHNNMEVPEKAAKLLEEFYIEKIYPLLNSAENKLYQQNPDAEEFSQMNLEIEITKDNLDVRFNADYWGSEEENEDFELPEEIKKEAEELLPGEKIAKLYVEYSGGGDSGHWDKEMGVDTESGANKRIPITTEIDNWVSANLPGGWEINEGSTGTFYFNFETDEINLIHQWNAYENVDTKVLDLDF
jgi:hypothetical protein